MGLLCGETAASGGCLLPCCLAMHWGSWWPMCEVFSRHCQAFSALIRKVGLAGLLPSSATIARNTVAAWESRTAGLYSTLDCVLQQLMGRSWGPWAGIWQLSLSRRQRSRTRPRNASAHTEMTIQSGLGFHVVPRQDFCSPRSFACQPASGSTLSPTQAMFCVAWEAGMSLH